VDGNPADLLAGSLGLSGMQAGPDGDPQLGDCRDNPIGGANRLRRLTKRSEEPVSGGIDLSTTEPAELSANRGVVGRNELPPGPVPEAGGQIRRPHDVREQNCRQEPLWRSSESKHAATLVHGDPFSVRVHPERKTGLEPAIRALRTLRVRDGGLDLLRREA
jgi:hypothetical protein